jgi:hypothetical protein
MNASGIPSCLCTSSLPEDLETTDSANDMPDLHEFWDPNEWEDHAFQLLRDRHGSLGVNKVPARHKGDYGLDYYSLQDRVAYQCFAVQEPVDVAQRAEKQKRKITTDLAKFVANRAKVAAIFGDVQVYRWVLLVPLHDSALVNVHTTSKTAEVRGLNLPYTSSDFEVMVQDLQCFDAASRMTRSAQRLVITLPFHPSTDEEIEAWAQTANELVQELFRKLRKRVIGNDPETLEQLVDEAIGWFLERENTFDELRASAPDISDRLSQTIARRFNQLRLLGPSPDGTPHAVLRQELEELVVQLRESIPNLDAESAHRLALGSISDWLMRCPLDFPPYDDVSRNT